MFICENCKIVYEIKYGSGRFCSCKCARNFTTQHKRKEINKKIRNSLMGKGNPPCDIECKQCKIIFRVLYKNRRRKFCSKKCSCIWQVEKNNLSIKGGIASARSQTRRSKNEILFANKCIEHFNNVKINEVMFNGWDADIIIEDYKIAIIWNGAWHYKKITKKHSVEQVQNRDRIKIKEIEKCGYIPYVIKDLGKYNPLFVTQHFNIFLEKLSLL